MGEFVGKVSYKADIDSQIARLRANGYKQAKKIPHGLTGDRNRCFVKLFSGVLNIYAIINEYGRVYYHFDLQKGPFLKMVKELEAVTELYRRYDEKVKSHFKENRGETTDVQEVQRILSFTRKNEKLLKRLGKKYPDFLKKYSDFYTFCVRFIFRPGAGHLFSFVLGQSLTKGDRTMFFKFFNAVLEKHRVFVEIRGVPKGARLRYTPDVRKRAGEIHEQRRRDSKDILQELQKAPYPYKVRELVWKYKLPQSLIESLKTIVIDKGKTRKSISTILADFALRAVYYDLFHKSETHPEYLRKKLHTKQPISQPTKIR